jgi:hypothetical protein
LAPVLVFLIQWGGAQYHPGPANLLEPLMLLLFGVVVGAVLLSVLGVIVPRSRRRLRDWRQGRRQTRAAATAEHRARAIMSELCPFGWQAQLTLFDTAGGKTAADGEGARAAVALDWAELSAHPMARPAVMRRVWAPTIAEALQAMVADRQTDEALEQIEQLAAADGALWPDLESGSA